MPETQEQQIRPSLPTEPDPLGKLYHMSTTAGVGSQDYVAVNVVSVVAVLLGLASSLALLDPMLLAVPLLAILFAAIALWQIGRSGGTQTGRLLAWGGMALAVLFTAMEGTRLAAEHRQNVEDRQAIASLVDQLTQTIRSDQMDQAYALFSSDFRERVTIDKFKGEMHLLQENPSYGKFLSVNITGDLLFEGGYDEDVRQAVTRLEIRFDKHAAGVVQVIFSRRDGIWSIDNLPELFPPASQPR
jgi:hypothetical protein